MDHEVFALARTGLVRGCEIPELGTQTQCQQGREVTVLVPGPPQCPAGASLRCVSLGRNHVTSAFQEFLGIHCRLLSDSQGSVEDDSDETCNFLRVVAKKAAVGAFIFHFLFACGIFFPIDMLRNIDG